MITTKNKFGLLHSFDDQPSIINNGDLYWHKDGLLHRDNDMPSIVMNNGDKYWYINGVQSRLDISLPYVEKSDGEKHYMLENGGKRKISNLREDWFNKDNEWHREDGPATIRYYKNGNIEFKAYHINGKLHREDGPALISYYENGNIESEQYYLNDFIYSQKKYLEKIKELKSCNKMT
jgi:antitoxin component YwqK of YwqJK toxin-antitoxin module